MAVLSRACGTTGRNERRRPIRRPTYSLADLFAGRPIRWPTYSLANLFAGKCGAEAVSVTAMPAAGQTAPCRHAAPRQKGAGLPKPFRCRQRTMSDGPGRIPHASTIIHSLPRNRIHAVSPDAHCMLDRRGRARLRRGACGRGRSGGCAAVAGGPGGRAWADRLLQCLGRRPPDQRVHPMGRGADARAVRRAGGPRQAGRYRRSGSPGAGGKGGGTRKGRFGRPDLDQRRELLVDEAERPAVRSVRPGPAELATGGHRGQARDRDRLHGADRRLRIALGDGADRLRVRCRAHAK